MYNLLSFLMESSLQLKQYELETGGEKESILIWCLEHLSTPPHSVVHINHRPSSHHSNMKTKNKKLLDKVCFPLWDEAASISNSLEPCLLNCLVTYLCTCCSKAKISTSTVRCVDEHLSPVRTENVKRVYRERRSRCLCGVGGNRKGRCWGIDAQVYWGINQSQHAHSETFTYVHLCNCM